MYRRGPGRAAHPVSSRVFDDHDCARPFLGRFRVLGRFRGWSANSSYAPVSQPRSPRDERAGIDPSCLTARVVGDLPRPRPRPTEEHNAKIDDRLRSPRRTDRNVHRHLTGVRPERCDRLRVTALRQHPTECWLGHRVQHHFEQLDVGPRPRERPGLPLHPFGISARHSLQPVGQPPVRRSGSPLLLAALLRDRLPPHHADSVRHERKHAANRRNGSDREPDRAPGEPLAAAAGRVRLGPRVRHGHQQPLVPGHRQRHRGGV